MLNITAPTSGYIIQSQPHISAELTSNLSKLLCSGLVQNSVVQIIATQLLYNINSNYVAVRSVQGKFDQ